MLGSGQVIAASFRAVVASAVAIVGRGAFRALPPLAALVLFALLSSTAMAEDPRGAIKGTLANQTAEGSSVANQEVILAVFSEELDGEEVKTRTDQSGNFVFDKLEVGSDFIYQLATEFQGVPYYSLPLVLPSDMPEQSVTLAVCDTTTAADVVQMPARHFLVQPVVEGVVVSEIVVVRNSSDRTYVGEKEVQAGIRETLHLPLPAGAMELQIVDGLIESRILPVQDGFVDTMPIYPGDSQRIFQYLIPTQGDAISFTSKTGLPVEKVSALIPDAGFKVSISNLPEVASTTIQGEKFLLLSGQDLPAGAGLQFKLEGLSKLAGSQSGPSAMPMLVNLLVGSGIGLLAIVAVGVTFVRRRRERARLAAQQVEGTENDAPMAEQQGEQEDELEMERQDLVAAIASLDDAYEQGRIGAEEYGMLRGQQKLRLMEIVAQQQEASGSRGES